MAGNETKTKRSRRVATAPATILAACIGELDKLDDATRARVLQSIHAYYAKPAVASLHPYTGKREKSIVDEIFHHENDPGGDQ